MDIRPPPPPKQEASNCSRPPVADSCTVLITFSVVITAVWHRSVSNPAPTLPIKQRGIGTGGGGLYQDIWLSVRDRRRDRDGGEGVPCDSTSVRIRREHMLL